MSEQWYCPNCGPMSEKTVRYEIHDVPLCAYCDSEIDLESTEGGRDRTHLYNGCYAGHCAMDLISDCPMQDEKKASIMRAEDGIFPLEIITKTPEILWPALRQYRHNYGNEEFIIGFDYTEICTLVLTMQKRIAALENTEKNLRASLAELGDDRGALIDRITLLEQLNYAASSRETDQMKRITELQVVAEAVLEFNEASGLASVRKWNAVKTALWAAGYDITKEHIL